MSASVEPRSQEREVKFTFRLSKSDHNELKSRAGQLGISVQAYLLRVALDRPDTVDLPRGPRHAWAGRQEELPQAG